MISPMKATISLPLIALLAACGSQSETMPAPTGDVPVELAKRHDNFEAIGDSFKVIREQLEGEADMAAIEAAALDISERALLLEGHFPEGTSMEAGYDTEALASIWERPEEFTQAREAFITQSAEMLRLAQAGDPASVGAQVGELGGTCKGCHDEFRVDDD